MDEKLPFEELYLTDGGVYDNLGTSAFREGLFKENKFDYIVVSDGAGRTDWTRNRRVSRMSGAAIRAIDVFMTRSRDLQRELATRDLPNAITLEISKQIDDNLPGRSDGALPEALQAQLKYIRTDLDAFPEFVRSALIEHGHDVAVETLGKELALEPITGHVPLLKRKVSDRKGLPVLRRARYRNLGLVSPRDAMASMGNLVLLLLFITIVTAGVSRLPDLRRKVPFVRDVAGFLGVQALGVQALVEGMSRPLDGTAPTDSAVVYTQSIEFLPPPGADTFVVFTRESIVDLGPDRYDIFWQIRSDQWPVMGILFEQIARVSTVQSELQVPASSIRGGRNRTTTDDSHKPLERTFWLPGSRANVHLRYLPPVVGDTAGTLWTVGPGPTQQLTQVELLNEPNLVVREARDAEPPWWNSLGAALLFAQDRPTTSVPSARVRDWLTARELGDQLRGRRHLVELGTDAFPLIGEILAEDIEASRKVRLLHNVTRAFLELGIGAENVPIELRVAIGVEYYNLQDFSLAARYLAAVPIDSIGNDWLYFARGFSYRRAEQYSEAVRDLGEYHSRTASGVSKAITSTNLGLAYADWAGAAEDPSLNSEAEAMYRRAIEEDPDLPVAYNNLAYLIAELRSAPEAFQQAIGLVDRALELRPEEPNYLDTKGWLHYRLREYVEALELIELANRLQPGDTVLIAHQDSVRTAVEGGRR